MIKSVLLYVTREVAAPTAVRVGEYDMSSLPNSIVDRFAGMEYRAFSYFYRATRVKCLSLGGELVCNSETVQHGSQIEEVPCF